MPLAEDVPLTRRRSVVVEPSPALELFGVTLGLHTGRKHRSHPLFDLRDPGSGELARRVRDFWPDQLRAFAELLVAAQAGGLLFEPDAGSLLARLPDVLRRDDLGEAGLVSETPEHRAALLDRLDSLRRKPALRRRWAELLGELWVEVRPAWEREGRRRVAEACAAVRRRLERGETVWDLDAGLDCWREEPHGSLMESAGAIVPSYFLGSWLVLVDLPGLVLVGLRLDTEDPSADLRRRAAPLAERLKALADPTRLAILAHVAASPGRITDVAKTFGISQPTASVHFRVLRDAGLVVSQRRDGQTLYAADRRRLRGLQEEVGRLVVGR